MNIIRKIAKSQLIGFISFIIIWELLHLTLRTHTIPSPMKTFQYTIQIWEKLLRHSIASIGRISISISISLIIGIPIGICIGINKWCRHIFSPLLYFIYPIPKVAFLPIFMLLFGLGNLSKIILIIWIIVFQIILSVRDGVDQIPELHFKVMKSYCATSKQVFHYLIIPAIIPQIFSGLRISIGISLASLFFAENYATKYGIGYFILSAWTKMNYVEMFSGILVLGLVGVILFQFLDKLEQICTPWMNKGRVIKEM